MSDLAVVKREEFGASQVATAAERSVAAVAAREQATVQAEYIMAERHPRVWLDVRAQMLDHCKRPRFAEVSRYCKPVGKKFVNGEWIEEYARGWSARFAETLSQEMGNVKPWSSVVYEDADIRILRIGVTDLQKNVVRAREVAFAKAIEKRGRKNKKSGDWDPPEGREVISQRLNTHGDPVYLVRATDDEMRNRINSEESKTQRDFILRLCPRDILEECEEQYQSTMSAEDKRDPGAALKKLLDRFHEFGIMPSDLNTYMGKPAAQFTAEDIRELRELGGAIRDGQTTFQEALKVRFAEPEAGEDETDQQHDSRLQRQMAQQERKAKEKQKVEERIAEATAINESRGQKPEEVGQSNPAPAAASNERPDSGERMAKPEPPAPPKDNPSTKEKGGAQKPVTVATERQGETPAAASGTRDEIPGSARPGWAMNAEQKQWFGKARQSIGDMAYYNILGGAGYERLEDIPAEEIAAEIATAMEERANQPAPEPRKMQLGNRRRS